MILRDEYQITVSEKVRSQRFTAYSEVSKSTYKSNIFILSFIPVYSTKVSSFFGFLRVVANVTRYVLNVIIV